jgi:hypothetical protein
MNNACGSHLNRRLSEQARAARSPLSRRPIGVALVCLAVILFLACRLGGLPPHQVRKLSSGKSVKVQSVTDVNFGDGRRTFMVKYLTDIKIDDRLALRREADEIWVDFKAEAERANVSSAVLSATSLSGGGIIPRGRSYNFVFQKDAAGVWKGLDGK